MTETTSLYQLLTLFETARKAGHNTHYEDYPVLNAESEVVARKSCIGWIDTDTCVALRIPWDMVKRICDPQPYDAVAVHEAQLCLQGLYRGSEALWKSYKTLLQTPAGRNRLFSGDQDDTP